MDKIRRDLRSYYDEEARREARRPLGGPRVEFRDEFITRLAEEGRRSVVDFGAGPGRDGEGFLAAGLDYLGIDLAPENAALAAARGIDVVCASIDAVPVETGTYDAGWSMSTLMHLPDGQLAGALAEMARTLAPGAPMMIGLWGGDGREHLDDGRQFEGEQRMFFLRTLEQNTELLSTAGSLERAERRDLGPDLWEYHLFQLRV